MIQNDVQLYLSTGSILILQYWFCCVDYQVEKTPFSDDAFMNQVKEADDLTAHDVGNEKAQLPQGKYSYMFARSKANRWKVLHFSIVPQQKDSVIKTTHSENITLEVGQRKRFDFWSNHGDLIIFSVFVFWVQQRHFEDIWRGTDWTILALRSGRSWTQHFARCNEHERWPSCIIRQHIFQLFYQ